MQVQRLAVAPDGGLFFVDALSGFAHRIWHLRPDGKLEAWAGVGVDATAGAPLAARGATARATDLALEGVRAMIVDVAGRLIFSDGARVVRVEPQGGPTARLLWTGDNVLGGALALASGADGHVFVLYRGPVRGTAAPAPFALEAVDAPGAASTGGGSAPLPGQGSGSAPLLGQGSGSAPLPGQGSSVVPMPVIGSGTAPMPGTGGGTSLALDELAADGQLVRTTPVAVGAVPGDMLDRFDLLAGAGGGQIVLATLDGTQALALDLATATPSPVPGGGLPDATGNLWRLEGAAASVRRPDGTVVHPALPPGAALGELALAPDAATAYAVQGRNQVVRLQQGTSTPIAGRGDGSQAAPAVALEHPVAAVPGEAGTLYVAEGQLGTIVAVGADGKATTYARGLAGLRALVRGAHGDLVAAVAAGLARVPATADHAPVPLSAPPGVGPATALAVLPDGTLYVAPGDGKLYRLDQGGYTLVDTGGTAVQLLAVDAAGSLWTFGRVPEAPGVTDPHVGLHVGRLAAKGGWQRWSDFANAAVKGNVTSMAVDARGRVFLGTGANLLAGAVTLVRFDTPDATPVPVAGQGAAVLAGSAVDNGLADVTGLAFDAAGNLLITDVQDRQVKRVPASLL